MDKKKEEILSLRLDTATKEKLENIAKNKERTTSNLIRLIIKQYLSTYEI